MFKATFFSRHQFNTDDEASDLLRLINEYGALVPTHFEERYKRVDHLPFYRSNNLTQPIKLLKAGSLYLKNSFYEATFGWQRKFPARWDIKLYDAFFEESGRLLMLVDFVTSLCRRFPVLFGGVAPEEDWEAKHWLTETGDNGGQIKRCYGAYMVRSLPGIYWLTIFGTQLVSHFGHETIKGLEMIHSCIDLGTNGLEIMMRENPTEDTLVRRMEHDYQVVEALGKEYFFDIEDLSMPCRPIKGITDWGYD